MHSETDTEQRPDLLGVTYGLALWRTRLSPMVTVLPASCEPVSAHVTTTITLSLAARIVAWLFGISRADIDDTAMRSVLDK